MRLDLGREHVAVRIAQHVLGIAAAVLGGLEAVEVRVGRLLVTAGMPCLEGDERGEVAEAVGPPVFVAGLARLGIADRHPLEIGPHRGVAGEAPSDGLGLGGGGDPGPEDDAVAGGIAARHAVGEDRAVRRGRLRRGLAAGRRLRHHGTRAGQELQGSPSIDVHERRLPEAFRGKINRFRWQHDDVAVAVR